MWTFFRPEKLSVNKYLGGEEEVKHKKQFRTFPPQNFVIAAAVIDN